MNRFDVTSAMRMGLSNKVPNSKQCIKYKNTVSIFNVSKHFYLVIFYSFCSSIFLTCGLGPYFFFKQKIQILIISYITNFSVKLFYCILIHELIIHLMYFIFYTLKCSMVNTFGKL